MNIPSARHGSDTNLKGRIDLDSLKIDSRNKLTLTLCNAHYTAMLCNSISLRSKYDRLMCEYVPMHTKEILCFCIEVCCDFRGAFHPCRWAPFIHPKTYYNN